MKTEKKISITPGNKPAKLKKDLVIILVSFIIYYGATALFAFCYGNVTSCATYTSSQTKTAPEQTQLEPASNDQELEAQAKLQQNGCSVMGFYTDVNNERMVVYAKPGQNPVAEPVDAIVPMEDAQF